MTDEEGSSSTQEIKPVTTEDCVQIIIDQVNNKERNYKFSPIYMAPSRFRELSPTSFTPRVVSIGPMHKDNITLKSMEAQKPTFLNDLLSKGDSLDEETLKNCMNMVSDNIEKIKRCYFGMKKTYSDNELKRMTVMDGCFILQFLSKLCKSVGTSSENRLRNRSIALDLVLLENQIPFFVLQYIYDQCTFKDLESKPSLNTMLCILLEHVNPFKEKLDEANLEKPDPDHILGLLHKFYQPKNTTQPEITAIPAAHSVVNLDKVGVRFRPKEEKYWPKKKTNWPMAMEFESSGKPTLIMPVVKIDHFFEVVIRNLIVYEQFSPVKLNHVTSYAMAMDMLADSPDDIAKLGQADIIINHIGSNEKASNMINNICKDVTFVEFCYIDPWRDMDEHYKNYWSRNFGVLKRTYFSNPWKVIALIVGIILFSINIVQFSFYLKDK